MKNDKPEIIEGPKTAKDIAALTRLVSGDTKRSIARDDGRSERTIRRVEESNSLFIATLKEQIGAKFRADIIRATEARLCDAKNVESKTGAQSYRVVGEAMGLIGGRSGGGVNVHVGDVHNAQTNVQVNAETLATFDIEELAALRKQLGVA